MAGETATTADGTHPTGMHSCRENVYKIIGWHTPAPNSGSILFMGGAGGVGFPSRITSNMTGGSADRGALHSGGVCIGEGLHHR